ncbi:peptidase M50 [Streptomyces sp. CNQ-509]|uniref:site-2 protease family protein n=1 Tax=unclassified Streptomyces TaxID=2593676 RepID=UPI00062DCD97|nr:site-2 protease family protein [Streptomyces sp. CNQ-509]AKH82528.1 peptidase M50 [Streptomyces sp. CNQ-509]
MRATFTLGRIAGIRVGVHWSVVLIFGIILVGLAQGQLPDSDPGRPRALYWAAGLVAALVFFVSLLAHELAHAVVARRNGVDADDIVLWLLGGVARLKSEASSPGAELRIAGIGPLVSLVLGGLFVLGTWLLHHASAPELVVQVMGWLAGINLLLAVFNSLPAAPLDGGRLLRALLWWRTGDRLRAIAGATAAGRALGWLLIVLGFVWFLRGGGFSGLWLALIGWFLIGAATAESRQAQLRGVLSGVPVRNAMTPDPVVVPASLDVAHLLDNPLYRHSAFPVLGGNGEPVGLVTLRGARHVRPDHGGTVTVGEVMVPLAELVVVGPDDSLADLLPRMSPGPEHRVLVTEEGRLAGILSLSDISRTVRYLAETTPRARQGP